MKFLTPKYKWIYASILVITEFFSQAPAYADKLYLVDEAKQEPSFKAFREQLSAAIKKRDSKFILNTLDPNITVSFGGCGEGVKCFKEYWKLNQPNNSQLWNTLSNVLALGGSFETSEGEKYFCAPYVFSDFPDKVNGEELMGVHEYAAIVGQNVNVRSRPNLNAPIITSLSYDIVKLNQSSNSNSQGWFKILAPTPGYVSSKFVRTPFDYRTCFKKSKGKWVMTALVAGD